MSKYLIWDFDDTLGYRSEGKWTASLMKVLAIERPDFPVHVEAIRPHMQSGFPWMTPDVPHTHIKSADAYWDNLFPLFSKAFQSVGLIPTEASRLARKVREVYVEPSAWQLFDDTLPVLNRLRDLGWTHCLLSNHVPELPLILSHLGIMNSFVMVVNSADTGYEKPHPQAFRLILEALKKPQVIWMIGDSYNADINGAQAMSIPGILVRKTHPNVHHSCNDLWEVINIVQKKPSD